MKRKKTIVWVLSFVMAFTVFGMMGASGAYGAEGSKGFTVTVNYTDGTSTNKRVIKKTYTQADLKQMAGDPQTGVGTAVAPVYYMVSKGYNTGVSVYKVGEGVKLWSLIRGAAGEDLTADGISSIRFWKDGSLTEYYDGLSSDQILSHMRQDASPPELTYVYPHAVFEIDEWYNLWATDVKEPVDPVLAIGYTTAVLDKDHSGQSKDDVQYHPDNDGAGYDNRVFLGILNTDAELKDSNDGSYWAPAESGGLDITLPAAGSIDKAAVTIGSYAKAYDGKAKTPDVKVSLGGKTLVRDKDYTVAFANNVNAGTATVKITGKGAYVGTKSCTFTLTKAAQNMTVKASNKTLKGKNLKKRKAVVKAIAVSGARGTVSYAKQSVSKKKYAKKFTVNARTGKITVKKSVKKGNYKIKVKVSATGDRNHSAASRVVTVKIRVK